MVLRRVAIMVCISAGVGVAGCGSSSSSSTPSGSAASSSAAAPASAAASGATGAASSSASAPAGSTGSGANAGLLRQKFLAPIKSGLNKSNYSPAFKQCVLRKAEAVSGATLNQMASDPSKAEARGRALGREWAQQCISSGIKP